MRLPDPEALRSLLAEQNEIADMTDRATLEDGSACHTERRYMGPSLGERVLIVELHVKARAQQDVTRSSMNSARIEAITWEQALSFGQNGHHMSAAAVCMWSRAAGDWRVRCDDSATEPRIDDGEALVLGMTIAEQLRKGDQLGQLAMDDADWTERAEVMVEKAVERAELVQIALRGW